MKKFNLSNLHQFNWKSQSIEGFYYDYFSKINVIGVIDQIDLAAQLGKQY